MELSVMSHDDVLRKAVVEIKYPGIFQCKKRKHEQLDPSERTQLHGPVDHRLGANAGYTCGTCFQTEDRCNGHAGYIRLASRVCHPLFQREAVRYLKRYCSECNVFDDAPQAPRCSFCRSARDKWTVTNLVFYRNQTPVSHNQVADILDTYPSCPDDTYQPGWLMLRYLLVPGTTAFRPSECSWIISRKEHAVTRKLCQILEANQKAMGQAPTSLAVRELIYQVSSYLNGESPGDNPSPKGGKKMKPFEGIGSFLNGKEGILRTRLLRKRCFGSGRTVIVPDPRLDPDQIMVPVEWKDKFVFQDQSDPSTAGQRITTEEGSAVMFGRMPVLHRGSFSGARINYWDSQCIAFHPMLCPPFNADFDGDEMNVQVPQSLASRAEVAELMLPSCNLLSDQDGGLSFFLVQDSIVAYYLLSMEDCQLDRSTLLQMVMFTKAWRGVLPEPTGDNGKWTGRQALCVILPEDLVYDQDGLVICRGQWVSGTLDKKKFASLTRSIALQYGEKRAVEWMTDCSRMDNVYLPQRGFTCGVRDLRQIDTSEVNGMVQTYLEQGGRDPAVLHSATSAIWSLFRDTDAMSRDNAFSIMSIYSKSKGNTSTITETMGAVGPSLVADRLPTAAHGAASPRATSPAQFGYIPRSLYQGLEPEDLPSLFSNTREALAHSVVSVPTMGELFRRLCGITQNALLYHDGTLRAQDKRIIQFHFGGDGLHPRHASRFRCRISADDYMAFSREYMWNLTDPVFAQEPELFAAERRHLDEAWRRLCRVSAGGVLHLTVCPEMARGRVHDSDEEETVPPSTVARDVNRLMEDPLWSQYTRDCFRVAFASKKVAEWRCSKRQWPLLFDWIRQLSVRSCVSPGEPMGLTSAQVLCRTTVQAILDTFKNTRSMDASPFERLQSIFRCSDNEDTRWMKLKLREAPDQEWVQRLPCLYLGDVIRSSTILYRHELDDFFVTSLGQVHGPIVVQKEWEGRCFFLRCVVDPLLVSRFPEMEAKIRKHVCPGARATGRSWEPAYFVVPLSSLEEAKTVSEQLSRLKLRGRNNIRSASCTDTQYVNLKGFNSALLTDPRVDASMSVFSDFQFILNFFGIEALRKHFFQQIQSIFQQTGSSIDRRHVSFLCDLLCFTGGVTPVDRTGQKETNPGFVSRATSQDALRELWSAALQTSFDDMRSVAGRLLQGKRVRCGTGTVELISAGDTSIQGVPKSGAMTYGTMFSAPRDAHAQSSFIPDQPVEVYIPEDPHPAYEPDKPGLESDLFQDNPGSNEPRSPVYQWPSEEEKDQKTASVFDF
jgi:DNA-directed RNA polymerase subunit A'